MSFRAVFTAALILLTLVLPVYAQNNPESIKLPQSIDTLNNDGLRLILSYPEG